MRSLTSFHFFRCCLFAAACCAAFPACSRLGWGVLLWSTEDPAIPSGTVLPVYIKSNIDKVWVVGVPAAYREDGKGSFNKLEIPLSRFELAGSKSKARKRAAEFAEYAHLYGENMQDGLPIRAGPDNGARRVYRLRPGDVIKILSLAQGNPAISASGDPLPGEWYRVLTKDGVTGYCFSYRLKLFDHYGGRISALPADEEETADLDLDLLLSKIWSPESYGAMLNSRRINLEELSRRWRFEPGQETGIARIYLPNLDRNFPYTAIRPEGERAWRFEGGNLQMSLRSDTTLAVQFTEGNGGMLRTLLFVSLPAGVDDLIAQESARREGLYNAIYTQGPVFTSNNYGTIVFEEDGGFLWSGFDLLSPQVIPAGANGNGTVSMDLFLGPALADRYNGAFTLHFAGEGKAQARFLFTLDSQGFRIEVAPDSCIEDITVVRRAASPVVLYFFRDTEPGMFRSPEW